MIPFLQASPLQANWLAWLDDLLACAVSLQQDGYEMVGVARTVPLSKHPSTDLPTRAARLRTEEERIFAFAS